MSERTTKCPNECGNMKMSTSTICTSCAANKNALIAYQNKRRKAGVTETGRNCSKCGEFKEWSEFRKQSRGINKKQSACKNCEKQHYKKMKHYIKKNGWTTGLWNACYEYQEGICVIDGCYNEATHADHDHVTEEPRALLCMGCNTALGILSEDVDKITGLLRYTEQCQNVKLTWKQD